MIQYDMTRYDTLWHNMTRYDTIWHNMTRYDKIWIWYDMLTSVSTFLIRNKITQAMQYQRIDTYTHAQHVSRLHNEN